jgi:enoyl-CoA hydratase
MSLVVVSRSEGVATLTLNNPAERNTLTAAMVAEIVEAMEDIEGDASIGAIVVTGAAPAFCAGANLGNLAEADENSLGSIYEGFLRIARSPLPTLAAVNGAAVGAGMNLALGCDVRLAARRAKFDTRFLQIGLHPGGGHTWMLRRIAGPQVAMAAVVFGEVMDGEEAARVGLAHRCVEDDQLLAAAEGIAQPDQSGDRGQKRSWQWPTSKRCGVKRVQPQLGPTMVCQRWRAGQDQHQSGSGGATVSRLTWWMARATDVTQSAFRTVGGLPFARVAQHRTFRPTTEVLHEPASSQSRGGPTAEDGCTSTRSQRAASHP